MNRLGDLVDELSPARTVGARGVAVARRIRVVAVLIGVIGSVGNVLLYLDVGVTSSDGALDLAVDGGRYEWGRLISGVAWVWALAGVVLALSFVVRGAAAALSLDVVRAEVAVASRDATTPIGDTN